MDNAVTLCRSSDYDSWLQRLTAAGTYDTYHLPGYQRLTTPEGYEPILLHYEAQGWRLTLPLTLRPLPEPARRASGYEHDATSVYGYPGPLLSRASAAAGPDQAVRPEGGSVQPAPADSAWRQEFIAWFTQTCAKLSILTVFLRNHPILDASQLFATEPFQAAPATPTVAVDLRLPEDERLAQASSHHRRALRKSLRHGLTFEPDHSADAIAGFTDCYEQTMAKHDASGAYRIDADRVAKLLDTLGHHAQLWVARRPDGVIASAGIFLVTGDIMQYHLGGTRTEDFALGAARPLFEAVANSGYERGLRWFHLGGGVGGSGDSLLRYKAGFGPDRFSYRTMRLISAPTAYEQAVRAVGLDPDRGFFPAYRTSGLGVL